MKLLLGDSGTRKALGWIIKKRRVELRISQLELAQEANLTQSRLSRIERGAPMDVITFSHLCQALDLEPAKVISSMERVGKALADLDDQFHSSLSSS